ncbi:MAG: methyltransferase domain-containing protein [Synechococcales cyanobacterium C42_A2020_086]|jgi:SAM-dependent methyltransferase|nr:methyltransferase domain-containing protein [Synechococcales cyanobacterium C42_A2020_086]
MQQSLPPSYFDALYSADPDPWKFETSDYEANKYQATIAALPRPPYRSAFEIGGSIGVLTALLAQHCEALLSIDVSEIAQRRAIERCRDLPHVQFELMRVPQQYPNQMFDLVVLSEVGYYWCWEDLALAQQQIVTSLQPGGHLLLVHWTQPAPDYPLTGDAVHESFLQIPTLRHLNSQREATYRLDVFERV